MFPIFAHFAREWLHSPGFADRICPPSKIYLSHIGLGQSMLPVCFHIPRNGSGSHAHIFNIASIAFFIPSSCQILKFPAFGSAVPKFSWDILWCRKMQCLLFFLSIEPLKLVELDETTLVFCWFDFSSLFINSSDLKWRDEHQDCILFNSHGVKRV